MSIRRAAVLLLAVLAVVAAAGPAVAPHGSAEQFPDYAYAPPMTIRLLDQEGRWRRPFVYPLELADRLERRYLEDRSRRITLVWLTGGRLVRPSAEWDGPVFLLGADALGRDVLARVSHGARTSMGVALAGALGALLLGTLAGAIAGYRGGWADEVLMRTSEVVLVLPAIYVVLALRTVLPLVLSPQEVFAVMAVLLAAVGWPYAARGVRAIVAAERTQAYVEGARAAGAGHIRIVGRHLLPACAGFLAIQAALLLPAFVLAEATLSFVGLGFPEPVPSWGTMLRDVRSIRALSEFPWLFAPAVAIVLAVLGINATAGALAGSSGPAGLLLAGSRSAGPALQIR